MHDSMILTQICFCCILFLFFNESAVSTNFRNLFWPKRAKLNAINDGHNVVHLYKQLGNEDSPTSQEPAFADANERKRICRNITGSRYFYWKGLETIDMDEKIFQELSTSEYPAYRALFHRIYKSPKDKIKKLQYSYEYTNEYELQEFHIKSDYSGDIWIREYVFVCLLRRCISESVVPLYVSKEYNVFAGQEPRMAGRFLLDVRGFHRHEIQLAENPAYVLKSGSRNLELYYLKMRQRRQPAASSDFDPICALVTLDLRNNQYHRLCAQVLTSDYFKEKIEYPRKFRSFECEEREISFRSKKAIRKAATKSYREFMIRCDATIKDTLHEVSVYVSRAYKKNEVFVYSVDEKELDNPRKLYLANLSSNVGLVVEPAE